MDKLFASGKQSKRRIKRFAQRTSCIYTDKDHSVCQKKEKGCKQSRDKILHEKFLGMVQTEKIAGKKIWQVNAHCCFLSPFKQQNTACDRGGHRWKSRGWRHTRDAFSTQFSICLTKDGLRSFPCTQFSASFKAFSHRSLLPCALTNVHWPMQPKWLGSGNYRWVTQHAQRLVWEGFQSYWSPSLWGPSSEPPLILLTGHSRTTGVIWSNVPLQLSYLVTESHLSTWADHKTWSKDSLIVFCCFWNWQITCRHWTQQALDATNGPE